MAPSTNYSRILSGNPTTGAHQNGPNHSMARIGTGKSTGAGNRTSFHSSNITSSTLIGLSNQAGGQYFQPPKK